MFKLCTLATKRLLSSAAYSLSRTVKRAVKPLFLNFPVTYKCNAKCVMCDIWGKYSNNNGNGSQKKVEDELTVDEIGYFVKRNKEFFSNLKSIGFSGGEAFLRKDIVEIVKVVRKELPWVDVGVQTNGLMPEMIREKISNILEFFPNFKIAVSMDGINGTHDKMRGVKGAYENAVRTIGYAKELGISGITCGMTLTKENFQEIRQVAEKVNQLGCEFSCFLPENSRYFGNIDGDYQLSQAQIISVAESLKSFSSHYFMDNLRRQISGQAERTLPCYSGYTSYVIDPYGDIFPCILRAESFGNIKDGSFKELVADKQAWELRRKIESCSCWCECEVSSSAIVMPLDVVRWFVNRQNKKEVIDSFNKKILIKRL